MTARRVSVVCLALLVTGLLTGLVTTRALAQEGATLFELRLERWTQELNEIELESKALDLTAERVETFKANIADLTADVQDEQGSAETLVESLTSQLEALGPKPAEGEAPESAEVARQREMLDQELAAVRGRVQRAELLIAKARNLDQSLTARTQQKLINHLMTRLPFPLSPSAWARAVPEFAGSVGRLLRSPAAWWDSLDQEQRESPIYWRFLVSVCVALVLGLIIRILVRRWFGRRRTTEEPSYSRRFSAAVAEAVGTGIVPALIFAAFLHRLTSDEAQITGLLNTALAAFFGGMIFVILAWALPRAVLSPDYPGWRLISIAPENANRICTIITCLVGVGVIDGFFANTVGGLNEQGRLTAWSRELQSVYLFVVTILSASLIIGLMRPSLWHDDQSVVHPDDEEAYGDAGEGADGESSEPGSKSTWIWRYGGQLVTLLSVIAVVAALIGYLYLGAHITHSLLSVGIVAGVVLLIRGVLRELIGVALRSRFLMESLRLRHPTRKLLKFWFRFALDVVAVTLLVFVSLPLAGVPEADVISWAGKALTEISIGSITISISDIGIALLAFLLVMLGSRLLQRILEDQVLPQTRLDIGVRNSLKAGVSYLGITIAVLIAISVIGLDLSNLAIIAGALSVGIGFGLQTIVNNFVSGLILLIERPVKAGDWIMAGGHEGFVKRINVRATEIETFQRASVIIPNSELLSSSLINWTHKDNFGRVEVDVGVAYGSDVDLVMKILQDALDNHPRILRVPESSVIFTNFGESSLDFQARGFLDNVLYRPFVASDLRVTINREFAEAGIEIPFPQRDLHLKSVVEPPRGIIPKARPSEDIDP